VLHCQKAALKVHGKYPVPLLLGQFHDPANMSEADVVVDDIDPPVKVHARLDHATNVVMASHVGTDCVGHAIFLSNDWDGFVRSILVHIGANHLRAFAGE
jgi:hypothetical protein